MKSEIVNLSETSQSVLEEKIPSSSVVVGVVTTVSSSLSMEDTSNAELSNKTLYTLIERFYDKYNPERKASVKEAMDWYKGREIYLLKDLKEKYGVKEYPPFDNFEKTYKRLNVNINTNNNKNNISSPSPKKINNTNSNPNSLTNAFTSPSLQNISIQGLLQSTIGMGLNFNEKATSSSSGLKATRLFSSAAPAVELDESSSVNTNVGMNVGMNVPPSINMQELSSDIAQRVLTGFHTFTSTSSNASNLGMGMKMINTLHNNANANANTNTNISANTTTTTTTTIDVNVDNNIAAPIDAEPNLKHAHVNIDGIDNNNNNIKNDVDVNVDECMDIYEEEEEEEEVSILKLSIDVNGIVNLDMNEYSRGNSNTNSNSNGKVDHAKVGDMIPIVTSSLLEHVVDEDKAEVKDVMNTDDGVGIGINININTGVAEENHLHAFITRLIGQVSSYEKDVTTGNAYTKSKLGDISRYLTRMKADKEEETCKSPGIAPGSGAILELDARVQELESCLKACKVRMENKHKQLQETVHLNHMLGAQVRYLAFKSYEQQFPLIDAHENISSLIEKLSVENVSAVSCNEKSGACRDCFAYGFLCNKLGEHTFMSIQINSGDNKNETDKISFSCPSLEKEEKEVTCLKKLNRLLHSAYMGSRVENRILRKESLVHQQRVREQQAIMDDLHEKLNAASSELEMINNNQDSLAVTAVKLTSALTSVDKYKNELLYHTKSTVELKANYESILTENHQLKSSVKSLSQANEQLVTLYQSHSMKIEEIAKENYAASIERIILEREDVIARMTQAFEKEMEFKALQHQESQREYQNLRNELKKSRNSEFSKSRECMYLQEQLIESANRIGVLKKQLNDFLRSDSHLAPA